MVDPLNLEFAQLLDLPTREVVGIELRDFRSHWLQAHPSLVALLRVATLIGLEDEESEDTFADRASGHLRQMVDWWSERRQRPVKRRALHGTLTTSAQ